MDTLFSTFWSHYHWEAALASLVAIVLINKVLTWLVFRHPDVQRMYALNQQEDSKKWKLEKYPPIVNAGKKVGLACNVIFFTLIVPFSASLQAEALWHVLLDVVLILMVYDFFYYFVHRFLFHGNGAMRKVHAVHHQARNPTFIDASYVHPLETFIGLALYLGTVPLLAAITGTFSVATVVVTYLIYVRLNQINHVHLDLPRFPFKTMTWAAQKHHVHHENMHKGNYATITLFYDKLFGTYE
ncbi:sterol desaturase family protein [Parahaliea maris]|uniref:Sterol desaturase family protein n=1 Tax=Parahaliea maris TaxID=2716870 RepID=A0A5C9A644_9GAMM|nr:sterol desaturase family protein [Parahaliea maris]TXS96176.1 sterol desaturase family protein [Parahaliea maris]